MKEKIANINELYQDRKDFCVIALTGYTAVGCTRLAEYMNDRDFYKREDIRLVESIPCNPDIIFDNNDLFFSGAKQETHKTLALWIFRQKYSICYNFIKNNYEPFIIIKYSKVLWLMTLIKIITEIKDRKKFKQTVADIVTDKFCPSHDKKIDQEYITLKDKLYWKTSDFQEQYKEYDKLYDEIERLKKQLDDERADYTLLAQMFTDDSKTAFSKFFFQVNKWLFTTDYYCACFFYHRLSYHIRTGESITIKYDNVFDKGKRGEYDIEHIYDVVKFMTKIIKALRTPNKGEKEKRPCRVVIDRLRTSLESRYLKERYSAFYLVAVHDEEDNSSKHLEDKVIHTYGWSEKEKTEYKKILSLQIEGIMRLNDTEKSNDDFEKGDFASPNMEQSVTDAEIHISNNEKMDVNCPYFRTLGEQWLKYASLIFHPALITPSSEERCMVVAYTAKFNSGCISRQVGAAITNEAHSIRTIGWNDVPYGQLPCSLRSLTDFVNDFDDSLMHSEFECGCKKVYGGHNFPEMIKSTRPYLEGEVIEKRLKGLPYSYCFKTFHNEFENKKNQVHTRSLHAEENAMLQMVRFGGMPLENGIIYVTSSPCELCCKKLYQIGVRKIVYIDEYPGISRQNIIAAGFKRPQLKQFQGAYGTTYFKLYQPIMPYKDELTLRLGFNMDKKESEPSLDETIKSIRTLLKQVPLEKKDDIKRKLKQSIEDDSH